MLLTIKWRQVQGPCQDQEMVIIKVEEEFVLFESDNNFIVPGILSCGKIFLFSNLVIVVVFFLRINHSRLVIIKKIKPLFKAFLHGLIPSGSIFTPTIYSKQLAKKLKFIFYTILFTSLINWPKFCGERKIRIYLWKQNPIFKLKKYLVS